MKIEGERLAMPRTRHLCTKPGSGSFLRSCRRLSSAIGFALVAVSCGPAVQLEVSAATGAGSDDTIPECDTLDSITFTVVSPRCALQGNITYAVVVGRGDDEFGVHGDSGGDLARGASKSITAQLMHRDGFNHDLVTVTVQGRCADGQRARGTFRCRLPSGARDRPT